MSGRWRLAGPAMAVAVAGLATLAIVRADGPAAGDGAPPTTATAIGVTSDAPRRSSLADLVAASEAAVRAEVVATEPGRVFGEAGNGRIRSRLVTLVVSEAMIGTALPGEALVVEEEGWLVDGTPLVVDGLAPSEVGDDGYWFLVEVSDADAPRWVVVSAQGRYLVEGGTLRGAAGDDPLVAELSALGPEGLRRALVALPG